MRAIGIYLAAATSFNFVSRVGECLAVQGKSKEAYFERVATVLRDIFGTPRWLTQIGE